MSTIATITTQPTTLRNQEDILESEDLRDKSVKICDNSNDLKADHKQEEVKQEGDLVYDPAVPCKIL